MTCDFDRRFSVPVLWDKKSQTIVNNESSEIIRMFDTAFNDLLPSDKAALTFYPEHLRAEIDEVNKWVYANINSETIFYFSSQLLNVKVLVSRRGISRWCRYYPDRL